MSAEIAAIAVVVPVHNEEELLRRCVGALRAAVGQVAAGARFPRGRGGRRDHLAVVVVLVLDSCDDGSRSIAEASGFDVLHTVGANVGAARAAGVERALSLLADHRPDQVWIANTDADSAVPPHWLAEQLAFARRGTEALVGTVRPDFEDLDPERRRAWTASHVPGVANGHVHGANLGVRADVYLRAGGYSLVPEHEDVTLMSRVRALGARIESTDASCVLTSGRLRGRTPGGYARHLLEMLDEKDAV